MAPEIIPMPKSRNNRACLLCSIIQSGQDFRLHGCPNCESFLSVCLPLSCHHWPSLYVLQLQDNQDRVLSCTSQYFDGMIALIDPADSWVAKWQRTSALICCGAFFALTWLVGEFARGIYAVRVKGRLPDEVENELKDQGITYRPRDLAVTEQD